MSGLTELKAKIFADGASIEDMTKLAAEPVIKGFTTNPSLMRNAGVTDYRSFAFEALSAAAGRPVSFEVFSDDFDEMVQQALEISSWGSNIYVKVPVTNTRGEFSGPVIQRLSNAGVNVNVTALMTSEQVQRVAGFLSPETPSIVSVFAGRVADTGRDPVPVMARAVDVLRPLPLAELIWASPRELLNIFQADSVGCHIITATSDLLAKLHLIGKDLDDYSMETVKMFHSDAVAAGYQIEIRQTSKASQAH